MQAHTMARYNFAHAALLLAFATLASANPFGSKFAGDVSGSLGRLQLGLRGPSYNSPHCMRVLAARTAEVGAGTLVIAAPPQQTTFVLPTSSPTQ
jgi:hypothetical protein